MLILDCCCSGAATIAKGDEDSAAKLVTSALNRSSVFFEEGTGKYLLASCLGAQYAYKHMEAYCSLFTYFILDGLKGGNGESVNKHGHVTPYTLGGYVYDKVIGSHPRQRPIIKVEASGEIILATYKQFARQEQFSVDTAQIMDEADQLLLQGDYPNAIDLYDQVIHLNPNYARPHYKKGIALGRLQKLTEANDSFDSAIQVDPTHYDAWYEKGNILVELGKENEAVDCYNKVMQIIPDILNHSIVNAS